MRKKKFSTISRFRQNFNLIFFKKKKFNRSFFNILKKQKKTIFNNFANSIDLSIQNTLIRCKIFLNYSDYFFFLKNNFIFLNKKGLKIQKKIKKGDFLELFFLKNYLFYLIKNSFLLNKLKGINFFKKKISFKTKKLSHNYLLRKIKIDFLNKDNNRTLLEIDFSILSFFFIKSNLNFFNLTLKTKKFYNIFYTNFLKWKLFS